MTGPLSNAGQPARRRFAPVPIETTFEQYRKGAPQRPAPVHTATHNGHPGPTGEPTPSPSPVDAASPRTLWTQEPTRERRAEPKEKRRFAPQLIESTRRSRRTGDVGPATKPIDKTDITPHHHHIYAPKTRKKHRKVQSLARRESCDDETAATVFEMLAREAEKRMLEEAALAVFPNIRARAGGAEHFVIREGSDDEDSSEGSRSRELTGVSGLTGLRGVGSGSAPDSGPRILRTARRSRRDSYTEDVGWALREMQEHHEQLTRVRTASIATGSPMLPAGSDAAAVVATPGPALAASASATPDNAALSAPRPMQIDRISTLELDRMSMESPPSDPLWTTTARQPTEDLDAIHPIGETVMPFIPEEDYSYPSAIDGYHGIPSYARKLRETEGDLDEGGEEAAILEQSAHLPPIGEAPRTILPAVDSATTKMVAPSIGAQPLPPPIPEETGFRGRNAYAGYRNRDLFASEREVAKLKKRAPPMLGKDLVFSKCQSPKQTKLEAQFLWTVDDTSNELVPTDVGAIAAAAPGVATTADAAPGHHGLWHGLCFSTDRNQAMVPIDRPNMLATPFPPSTPADPFAHAFSLSAPDTVYTEPASAGDQGSATSSTATATAVATPVHAQSTGDSAQARPQPGGGGLHALQGQHGMHGQNGLHGLHGRHSHLHAPLTPYALEAKGLHMLMGLDERLRQEKAAAELEEKIRAEFTDRFVTQVYNYLSLGYPAMARDYDEELAKISRIPVDELERDDDDELAADGGMGTSARGHISLDADEKEVAAAAAAAATAATVSNGDKPANGDHRETASPFNHDNCPRWRALKLYIYEWARQHPDLDNVSLPAWGVQERRGSWGV